MSDTTHAERVYRFGASAMDECDSREQATALLIDAAALAISKGGGTLYDAIDRLRDAVSVFDSAGITELVEALSKAVATIEDYVGYEHDGDPWSEDARVMGEMDINDYANDGRLEKARAALAKAAKRK